MPPIKSCHFGFTIHFIVFLQNLYSTILPHLINQIRHGSYSVVSLSQPQFSENSNVLYFLPGFRMFHIPSIFALKQLKISEINMLFGPIGFQIFCILLILSCSHNLQEIMKVSFIYSRILEHPKVAGLQLKISLKRFCPNFGRANLARRNIYNLAIAFT